MFDESRRRESSAYSHNMRRKIMANVGISQKNKAKCCISHTKNRSKVFSADLDLFSVSSILLVLFSVVSFSDLKNFFATAASVSCLL